MCRAQLTCKSPRRCGGLAVLPLSLLYLLTDIGGLGLQSAQVRLDDDSRVAYVAVGERLGVVADHLFSTAERA
jgi:hypothetical protein